MKKKNTELKCPWCKKPIKDMNFKQFEAEERVNFPCGSCHYPVKALKTKNDRYRLRKDKPDNKIKRALKRIFKKIDK